MQCTRPIWINVRLPKNGKSFLQSVEVPCGKCMACRIALAREWSLRLLHESYFSDHSLFVTLTYSDPNLPAHASLVKKDLQDFFKRLRKWIHDYVPGNPKVKYYACGEYGSNTNRPHYHFILFGLSESFLDVVIMSGHKYSLVLERLWTAGYNTLGTVTYDSCRYVADYVQKKYSGPLAEEVYTSTLRQVPFRLSSLGLGLKYAEANREQLARDLAVRHDGQEYTVPRYYRKKLELPAEGFQARAEEREKDVSASRSLQADRLGYSEGQVLASQRKRRRLELEGKARLLPKGKL